MKTISDYGFGSGGDELEFTSYPDKGLIIRLKTHWAREIAQKLMKNFNLAVRE